MAGVIDVFEECKARLTMREVSEGYGFRVNRAGFATCPFHHEKTASLKIYPGSRGWHCFGCHKGGSVIDFARELFGLSPLDAVKRLNQDFHLGLPLDHKPTEAERREVQERRRTAEAYKLFEAWRSDIITWLNACYREGHLALKQLTDFDHLTDQQALAIKMQATVEYYSDILSTGTIEEQMEIFRDRGKINKICSRILGNMPMKSSAA